MKGDLHPVAFRLSQQLGVRTHEAREWGYAPDAEPGSKGQKRIRVKGVEYTSLSEARRKLACAFKTLHRMVQNGEAEFV